MTTLFAIFAALGFGVLLLGVFVDDVLGGMFDALDIDAGGVLSLPVIGAFLGAFGVGGLVTGAATDGNAVASIAGGGAGGLVLGWAALRLSGALIDMPTDATPTSGDFQGQIARVVTPIEGGTGEIMARVGGAPRKLAARCDVDVPHGADVVVVEVLSSSAVRVVPMSQILEDPSS